MHFSWLLCSLVLPFALSDTKRFIYSTPLFIACFFYASSLFSFSDSFYVEGLFFPHAIEKSQGHFRKGWIVRGYFTSKQWSSKAKMQLRVLPRPISSYLVEGVCKSNGNYECTLYPKKQVKPLEPYPILEKKWQWMQTIDRWIYTHVQEKGVAEFLRAFFFGKKEDLYLQYCFQALGLSHILAISGFHFCLFATVFFGLFRLLFPLRIAQIFCLILLGAYTLFLQNSPSSLRAFSIIFLFLLADLFGKRISIYNALGASLLFWVLYDPTFLFSPSFQLSYLSCFALLLFYPKIGKVMQKILCANDKNNPDRLVQKWSLFLQNALAASFAIYLFTAPVILARFSQISYAGVIYNLFIPYLIGVIMSLWAIFWPFCICHFFASCLTKLTQMILNICLYPPVICKNSVYSTTLSEEFAIFWIFLLLFIGFTLQQEQDFGYDS